MQRITASLRADRESSHRLAHSRHLITRHLHKRTLSPSPSLGHGLRIRRRVEGDEEEEVRREDADTGHGGEFLAGAVAGVGHPGPVGGGEVGVGCEVDEAWGLLVGWRILRQVGKGRTEIDDELGDLHDGDVLFPPDADASGALEIVPVHDNMDGYVQRNGDPLYGCVPYELSVAKKSSCGMVVTMEKCW